jgi:hypothetical protein
MCLPPKKPGKGCIASRTIWIGNISKVNNNLLLISHQKINQAGTPYYTYISPADQI